MRFDLKIRFSVKHLGVASVLVAWLFSMLACSQDYISLQDLNATAQESARDVQPTNTPINHAKIVDGTDDNSHATVLENSPDNGQPFHSGPPTLSTLAPADTQRPPILYTSQSGDCLQALAARFDVSDEEITCDDEIPEDGFLKPGMFLVIPDRLGGTGPADILFPDSEVLYSPTTIDFDVEKFVMAAGGKLSTYREYRENGWHTGVEIIEIVSRDESINPMLLLSLLEYQSHWIYGQPRNKVEIDYPIGWTQLRYKGLYYQLKWAVQQLSLGYYGWRNGKVSEISFPDQGSLRLAPDINAGTVALQYLFSKLYDTRRWFSLFYDSDSFLALHEEMFGDPWTRAKSIEPFFPDGLSQPVLELPFAPGHSWNFTSGPHYAWGTHTALAALDFAPIGVILCDESTEWVTASAPGVVVRTGEGLVVVDLDGDGHEQTGWVMIYMHVDYDGHDIQVGTKLDTNDPIGHPSCKGGKATGSHVHIARKYNGEWMLAGGAIPFVLSGWEAQEGDAPYEGTLTKDDQIIQANIYSSFETVITRPETSQ